MIPSLPLHLGFSPCPNDTFMFHALVHGTAPVKGVEWEVTLADIEELNRKAFAGDLDVTKISFHALGLLRDRYALLASGSALGRGCGPLIVTARDDLPPDLRGARIAVPGRYTSALLLLRLYAPHLTGEQFVEMTFDRILGACATGEVDAGLIIHESRFTYAAHGLRSILDLGEWWEETSGLPLPLGGIAVARHVPEELQREIEAGLRDSVRAALHVPGASQEYVQKHAQEMSREVQRAHIDLYVNDFSVNLGPEGENAVRTLLRTAEERGVIPPYDGPLMVGEE